MLSKSAIKYINSLKQKKFRQRYRKFTAEGDKIVNEILENSNINIERVFAVSNWIEQNPKLAQIHGVEEVTFNELKKISSLQTPNQILAVLDTLNHKTNPKIVNESLSLVLDNIQDPGNLGTIIRLCDWFGLSELFCSKTTVDCFNSKVIQASMGSITRVRCHYVEDLGLTLNEFQKPIYGASVKGNSIFSRELPKKASYVFGSESHGISKSLSNQLTGELSIPNLREGINKAESLNVANSTAIFLSELFR